MYIYIYIHCLYCIVWHSMMLIYIYIYIYSVYHSIPWKRASTMGHFMRFEWDQAATWWLNGTDKNGIQNQQDDMWRLAKGVHTVYIYPIYGNLNAECDDSPVASGARYFSDKGIYWGKTLLSSRYSQQNQSSDYGFCMFFFPKYKVHMNKTSFLEKHTRNTW